MARRECCIPGVVLSIIAAVLLVLGTVSLPLSWSATTPFSVVNAYDMDPPIFDITNGSNTNRQVTWMSFGNWGYCSGAINSGNFCNNLGSAYEVRLRPSGNTTEVAYAETSIDQSWTRGLVVVVVAFVFSILALVTAVIPHLLVMLVSSILHLITMLLALIAFIIQIVMFAYTRNRILRVSPGATVMPGVAFYLTLISIPLLLLAAVTVCCGRREKDEYAASSSAGGGNPISRIFKRKNRSAKVTAADDAEASIPMDSRAKVLSAFNESKA